MKLYPTNLHKLLAALSFAIAAVGAVSSTTGSGTSSEKEEFCPNIYHKGVMHLDINPAFLHVDQYNTEDGGKVDGLTVSSFFTVTYTFNPFAGIYVPDFPPVEPDQVGRIMDVGKIKPDDFDFLTDFERITDDSGKTTWPNEAIRVPDGVLPFEAVIIPQGFHTVQPPGRLSIVNLNDPSREEYIVHQSTFDSSQPPGSPANSPRFYHEVLFYDMDGDGLQDIVTVRSGFKIIPTPPPPTTLPPFSELVWFKNPGAQIDPATPWTEKVLYGGPMVNFLGPDISLAMYDFENDGIPEIVATHFFTGDDTVPPPVQPMKGKIAIYGATNGGNWTNTNVTNIRSHDISTDQGFPFAVEIVDLNADGKVEILATNHQPNCAPFQVTPGRIYALEQPASGNIFDDPWPVRVLLDDIFPQPTPDAAAGFRLAPGHALTFSPDGKKDKSKKRPWILASGDEAGKVWIMKPKGRHFDYTSAVVFDINDFYGEDTTQTFTTDGTTISTIGKAAFRYANGFVDIYIPVFEARDIHVLSLKSKRGKSSKSSKGKSSSTKSEKGQSSSSKSERGKSSKSKTKLLRESKTEKSSSKRGKGGKGGKKSKSSKSGNKKITCPADVTYACPST